MKIAIAGLGHVGCGLIDLVENQQDYRLGCEIEIIGVSARSQNRPRPVNIENYQWHDDPVEMAKSSACDVFVELIGGSDGPAKLAIEAALKSGKSVVTANKALMASHGTRLAQLAEAAGANLLFEASIAGCIPVVRSLRDSLAATTVLSISGILNGTCNYILTQMLETGKPYQDVLKEAQLLGYAEADPFLDVSGTDAAQKIRLLSTMAYGYAPETIPDRITGIDSLTFEDLKLALDFGYKVKLIAKTGQNNDGPYCVTEPCLVSVAHPLSQIDNATNAVYIEAEPTGPIVLIGAGAGAGPTAVAVMGDVQSLAHSQSQSAFPKSSNQLKISKSEEIPGQTAKRFIRICLKDKAGAFAAVTECLAEADISIDQLHQGPAAEQEDGKTYAVAGIITHPSSDDKVKKAKEALISLPSTLDLPLILRIEDAQ